MNGTRSIRGQVVHLSLSLSLVFFFLMHSALSFHVYPERKKKTLITNVFQHIYIYLNIDIP